MTSQRILLVGASVRAAANAARQSKRRVLAIDRFGDLDLRRLADECVTLAPQEYPRGIVEAARDLPEAPFAFTGGLENHPEIVADLERERANEGTPAAALPALRDPLEWSAALAAADLPHPSVVVEGRGEVEGLFEPGAPAWLVKPLCSCGGSGIQRHESLDAARQRAHAGEHYLQAWIDGVPVSAAYTSEEPGRAQLDGLTLQLIGEPELGASSFAYSGSIGPLAVSDTVERSCERIGAILAGRFPLRGRWGVDALLRGDDVLPVEINPRYTASMEVLERAARRRGKVHGKAVLFARERTIVGPRVLEQCDRAILRGMDVADLPAAEGILEVGQPLLTVFAAGPTIEACRERLLKRAKMWYGLLRADNDAAAQPPSAS